MNVKALKKKMIDRDVSPSEIANALHIKRNFAYRKLNGHAPLTLSQANKIGDLLNLSNEEYREIFFCP